MSQAGIYTVPAGSRFPCLKLGFLVGAMADFVIGANWFLTAYGIEIPNLLSGMVGEGADYRYAMIHR